MTQRYAHLHDDALKKASGVASTLFSQAGEPESKSGTVKQAKEKSAVKVRKKQKAN